MTFFDTVQKTKKTKTKTIFEYAMLKAQIISKLNGIFNTANGGSWQMEAKCAL